ncbi:MAG: sodium:solute symporter family protein [Fuerstiella sp.]|nr:sodium:solute symporter family protein [Fuerstiella sp.]
MDTIDYLVIAVYFVGMAGIGIWAMSRVKGQEDFFMGGRSFGKLLQTFAAFGAGTGSSDPINTGRSTFIGGMSGMWSVMFWLFVTPFYWITGVWYRRMRHLTLGDWYVERYESRGLGAAYSVFGVMFFMIYGSMFFSALAKTAEPMIGDTVALFGKHVELQYVLIPVVAVVVVVYGMAGGLAAAYFTDLIQGLCIIGLSVMLVPIGLNRLAENTDLNPEGNSGFQVMHDQLPESFFDVISSSAAEFSLYYLIAIVLANLTGIVVQPHFIATGGGSAKSEFDARVGLVIGNFLKRFCTVGWVLTALIAATLYADVPELINDPDRTWGYASMQLLGPGFRGLMLACLVAALMSSVDAYMIVGAGLIVRNLYVPFVNPHADERQCLWAGRLTGVIVVAGSVIFSLKLYDMLGQLKLTFWFPLVFAAPFWVGMYWRRATSRAAWITVTYCLLFFFIVPYFGPMVFSGLRDHQDLMTRTPHVRTISQELVSKSMLRQMLSAAEAQWKKDKEGLTGEAVTAHEESKPLQISADRILVPGDNGMQELQAEVTRTTTEKITKSTSIYWDKIVPSNPTIQPQVVKTEDLDEFTRREILKYPAGTDFRGQGNLKLNLLLYRPFGLDLGSLSSSTLSALELVPKIVMPFLVMVMFSLITPRNSREGLDRYYVKMKTPANSNPELDRAEIQKSYAEPSRFDHRKLFPGTDLEFQRPRIVDAVGFIISFIVCFGIIGIVLLVAQIGTQG